MPFASVQPVCFEDVGTGSAMENLCWTQREKLLPCTRTLGSAAGSSDLEAELLHLFETVMEREEACIQRQCSQIPQEMDLDQIPQCGWTRHYHQRPAACLKSSVLSTLSHCGFMVRKQLCLTTHWNYFSASEKKLSSLEDHSWFLL